MRELRDDQHHTLDDLRDAVGRGDRRICMQAPTGFGKTVLSAALVENARMKHKRVLYTVPAISLVDQTVEMFYSQGIREIGVIQAEHAMTDWSQPVQIASVQTLQKRTIPQCDVAMVDECHRWFKFYEKWFCDPAWQNIPIIGLSATPWTRGLGAYYKKLIIASTIQELIDKGLLAPFRVFAPSHPDLTGVRTLAGDYHEGELSERMSDVGLIADVVETWCKRAENRPTLCFAVDRAHAKHLQTKFEAAGVPCAYQDAYTSASERTRIRRGFHDGSIKVVCNVGTLVLGVDWDVRCISLCRPTKSDMLFVQIIGRGLRTAPGKPDCLVFDHSDNHQRLGFVTDIDVKYSAGLHDGKPPQVERRTDAVRLPKECPNCAYLKPPRMATCPNCGFVVVAHSQIKTGDGELKELKKPACSIEEKARIYAELKCYAERKDYKPGWATNKYREKFGVWPDHSLRDVVPAKGISAKTAAWIKSRQIAWAKGRSKRFADDNVQGDRREHFNDQYRDTTPMSERQQRIIDSVREKSLIPGTLCTKEDLDDL
ncbi:MAG TPA: DEAD/DEAH box helicase [Bradyrhizobium sp.]|jgi:superfamily II DNA or RNA helicase